MVMIGQQRLVRPPFLPRAATADPDAIAQAAISRHFDMQVHQRHLQLQRTLTTLVQAVEAAETARERWLTDRQITSTAAGGDPHDAAAVDKEVFALALNVDWPCQQAWKAARDNPGDQHAQQHFLDQHDRVDAVRHWLFAHGYHDDTLTDTNLDWNRTTASAPTPSTGKPAPSTQGRTDRPAG